MDVKIRKGDIVEVISGREEDKGHRGDVIKVMPKERRVVVQGVNVRTKHQRQTQAQGRTINPGKVKFEMSVPISSVMLVCPKCSKATRVAVKREAEKIQRVCKRCEALIDE